MPPIPWRLERHDGRGPPPAGWDDLAERARNPFGTWEWLSTWWAHWGGDRPLLIASAAPPAGRVVAGCALYLASRRPVRLLRCVGHGPGDVLGPLCPPGDYAAAGTELRALLDVTPGWDVLLAEQLPGTGAWPAPLGAVSMRQESCPEIDLEALEDRTWNGYLASRSANFRQQVRRFERRLARQGRLRYRLTRDTDELPRDLETVFGLHAARWGRAASLALGPARRDFHRDFAPLALARGWLRLWFAEIDGEAVAAWYGLRFAGTEWYYQAGRLPAWDRWSPGFVLLAHTVRAAVEDGMGEYRLLRGGEDYKSRFADRDPGLESVAVGRGPRGRLAVAAARAALRASGGALPPAVKRASGLAGR